MNTQEHSVGKNDIFVLEVTPESVVHSSPIVMVHGSFGGHWMWKKYIEFFAEQGWKIFALDLRGHHKSGGEIAGTTMDDYVVDVHEVTSHFDLKNPIIMGHSMAGLLTLMYGKEHGGIALVSIDPSPSLEGLGEGMEKDYKDVYTPQDAGMPEDSEKVMKALPDISKEMIMTMREKLGGESGAAREQRKRGISVPKDSLAMPVLFVGAEKGDSVPFGISFKSTQNMADTYDAPLITIAGATHPGILAGEHALDAAKKIHQWLVKEVE